MKRGKKILLIGTALILATLTVGHWLRSQEYQHGGRPVSAWLMDLNSQDPNVNLAAESALQQIGTNVMPTLVEFVAASDSGPGPRLLKWLADKHWYKSGRVDARFKHNLAKQFVRLLGNARYLRQDPDSLDDPPPRRAIEWPCLPQLAELFTAPDPETRSMAMLVAFELYPSRQQQALVIPGLQQALRHPDPETAKIAAFVLRNFAAEPPRRISLETRTRIKARLTAIEAIEKAHCPSQLAAPILIAYLDDPEPKVRVKATDTLAGYGSQARDAIPVLKTLCEDTNVVYVESTPTRRWSFHSGSSTLVGITVAHAAREALKAITPEFAAPDK